MLSWKEISSEKRATLAMALIFCVISGCWIATYTTRNFLSPDSYDYAVMGREIVQGHGLATKEVFPRHIGYLKEHGILNPERVPNLFRYPLATFCNALAQLVIADPMNASVIQSGLWFLLSIPLFFFLARDLTDPFKAVLCTVIFVSRAGIWAASNNGLTESVTILVLLALVYFLVKPSTANWKYGALGVSSALLCLARTQLSYVFVLVLLYLAASTPKPDRWRALLLSTVFFLVVFSPWMVRNYGITGNPIFSFHNTRVLVIDTSPRFSDLDMQLHAPSDVTTVLRTYGGKIALKCLKNFRTGILKFNRGIGMYILPVLVIVGTSYFFRKRTTSPEYERFKWLVVAMTVINTLVIAIVLQDQRFSYPLQPLLIIVLVQELFVILDCKGGIMARNIAAFVLLAYGCIFIVANVKHKYPPRNDSAFKRIADFVNPKSVIASDASFQTALFNNVLSIRLPLDPEELIEISERYVPIDFVMVSKQLVDPHPNIRASWYSYYGEYRDFLKTDRFLKSFEFVEVLSDGSVLYKRRAAPAL